MRWLKIAFDEVVGLFIDDASYAMAIVGWLAVVAALGFGFASVRSWLGPVLFSGLAVILAAGAAWRARRG